MSTPTENFSGLTSAAEIDPSIYVDRRIFDAEMELIFDRAWLLIGHDTQISEKGSFFTARAGGHSLVIWRGNDGCVRAFHNRCPHRGTTVCRQERGKANSFVCPYHGWVFDSGGALKSVPAPKEYGSDFNPLKFGLKQVAQLEMYRGFIFARHTTEGPSLKEFLGDMTSSIDDLVDRAPDGEIEICPIPLRHRFQANWKLCFENLNDAHHARVAHGATVRAASRVLRQMGDKPAHLALHVMKANGMPIKQFGQLDLMTAKHGHSYLCGFIEGQKSTSNLPKEYIDLMIEKHGTKQAHKIFDVSRHLTLLYPSATFQGRFQTMRLIQPLAPDLTEIVGYLFKLKGAPDSLFEQALHYFHISISPFSPVATDDFELYESVQRQTASSLADKLTISRKFDESEDDPSSNLHSGTSEAFIRNQYLAWRDYLKASSG